MKLYMRLSPMVTLPLKNDSGMKSIDTPEPRM